MHKEFEDSKGEKHLYYEIDASRRKRMMCHLAEHLRDFGRKLYVKFIQPNIGKPKKLKVPKHYEGIVKEKHWKKFVEWRLSGEFKRKAHQTKYEEYKDDDVKNVADEIIGSMEFPINLNLTTQISHEKEIAKGSMKSDQCADALTLVFWKYHSGRVRGVGRGVTLTKYWNIPCRKVSSNERIVELQKQLDVERQRSESAIKEVKHVSAKIEMKNEECK
ncbi:hypothetical protein OSB04_006687 [Centaurea solstitialis]|uniref:Uncharacterized protein n=1 Tax=Centaurea solstitialis TaxID=347529 RepID=A0AA38WHW6_9ASTR|nr:hypothetical protein OSB04_006687 [Centaurea solstitialis]